MESNYKKKIGIITCGREPNYGACLQALATLNKVNELGYDAELMNYSFMDEKNYLPFRQKSIRSFVSSVLFYKLRKSQHKAFSHFRERNMKYSETPIHTPEDFRRVCGDYDTFLIGSDQVWNPHLGINTDITLLRFYDEGPKRVAFSSSFGVSSIPKDRQKEYKEALDKFSYISTREVEGQQIVHSLINKEACVTLDPTMLMTATEWGKYEESIDVPERYVLVYDMRHSPRVMEYAKEVARLRNCKVLAISRIKIRDKDIRTLYGVTPGQFLSFIKKAEAVVTDSFHGTVFSILYQKEFYSYCSRRGMKIGSRITNILKVLDLEDRLIDNDSEVESTKPEYLYVTNQLSQMRKASLSYLRKALAGEEVNSDDSISGFYTNSLSDSISHVGEKDKVDCSGCGLCTTVCPKNAISMKTDEEGFLFPFVNNASCILCKKCLLACSFTKSYCEKNSNSPLRAYIARSKNDDILSKSASGGVFSVFSDAVLSRQGNIYGAIYNVDGDVKHICAQNNHQRDQMRGSKYVQSEIQYIYSEIIKDLKDDRYVFFSGTPCQVVAIHSYLRERSINCSKLILCDIICHGVSSPKVWREYLALVEKKTGKIVSINTRDKRYGSGYNMTICGDNGIYHRKGSDDPFIRLFQLNAVLRKSCFSCPLKRIERVSDITIGDFQKAKQFFPEYDDRKGVSVVFINTDKGATLFNEIEDKLDFKVSSLEAAMQVNLYKQIENCGVRDAFFSKYGKKQFVALLKEYTTLGAKNKSLYIAKTIVKKCLGRTE